MALTVDISVRHDAWRSIADFVGLIERAADAAEVAAKNADGDTPAEGAELSLVLCDDAFIHDLNRQWRNKDKATNVLSFPAESSVRHVTLGDVIIAYETVMREACDEGLPVADHLAHLVVHGVLHLLGFDHEEDCEAELMEDVERRALASLGIASPQGLAVPSFAS
jgi:probable rRNA maturation factor